MPPSNPPFERRAAARCGARNVDRQQRARAWRQLHRSRLFSASISRRARRDPGQRLQQLPGAVGRVSRDRASALDDLIDATRAVCPVWIGDRPRGDPGADRRSSARTARRVAVRAGVRARPAARAARCHAVRVSRERRAVPKQRLHLQREPAAAQLSRCSASCSRTRSGTASSSRARWRCCCGWAASRRGSRPGSRPARTMPRPGSDVVTTSTRTRGSRRGSRTTAGSSSIRRRRPRRRAAGRSPLPALRSTHGQDGRAASDKASGTSRSRGAEHRSRTRHRAWFAVVGARRRARHARAAECRSALETPAQRTGRGRTARRARAGAGALRTPDGAA